MVHVVGFYLWNGLFVIVAMKKIVIIGSSGAGKSTFARLLGSLLSINRVVHLDRVFWKRGWKEKPRDARVDILQRLVGEQQWIIEGSYLSSSDSRLEAADTIIFLDMFPLLCLWRIILRHSKYRKRPRRDIPDGCTDRISPLLLLKVLTFPFLGRRELEKKLRTFSHKTVIRLRSRKEVEGFLAGIALLSRDPQSSPTPSSVKEKASVLVRS